MSGQGCYIPTGRYITRILAKNDYLSRFLPRPYILGAAGGGDVNQLRIVVAGNICLDVTPVFPPSSDARALQHVIRPGSLVRLDGVDVHPGGAVANVGLAMELFGASVSFMGKIGDDVFGRMILDLLGGGGRPREEGGRALIVDPGATTSYTVVLAVPGNDRVFLHAPGANDSLGPADIDIELVAASRLFHFGYPPLMAAMYRNGGSGLVETFASVRSRGVLTSLDLAAVDERSEAGKEDWRAILGKVLPLVDFFLPSLEELAYMLDRPLYGRLTAGGTGDGHSLSVERDVEPLARMALALGAGVVMVKCGARGFYVATGDEGVMAGIRGKGGPAGSDWVARSRFERAFRPGRVRSATGAGDTTIAAFLVAALSGYGFERSCALAAATGASCVEDYGALGGLKPFAELEGKIDAGWERNDERYESAPPEVPHARDPE